MYEDIRNWLCWLDTIDIYVGNSINVNNKVLNIEKIKCKYFYWHLINKASHMPNNILKWCETYPDFKNADPKTWRRIFKVPFQVIRETRIQTFQYKIYIEWYREINGYLTLE